MLPTPATQVVLLDEDLEPEAETEFDASQKITITFTPYEKGHKIKDEEALSAIVAHLNKLEGVDLEPDFLSKSASGPWEILVTLDAIAQIGNGKSAGPDALPTFAFGKMEWS